MTFLANAIVAGAVLALGLGAAAVPALGESFDDPPTGRFDSIFIPTPQNVVELMLELAEVGPDDYVADLGSGDGRIPITAARKYGARGLGVELEPKLVEQSRRSAVEAGVADRVEFREQNLFDTELGEVTVLTLFLLPHVNEKLLPRILEQMAPGTRVVANQFGIGDWEPDTRLPVRWREVFLWIVPARVAGRWRLETADESIVLDLTQRNQTVEGVAIVDGRPSPLLEPALRGAEFRFAVERGGRRLDFAGRVEDDAIVPLAGVADTVADWRAVRE